MAREMHGSAGQVRADPELGSWEFFGNDALCASGRRRDYDGWAARGLPGQVLVDVLDDFRRLERDADLHHELGSVLARHSGDQWIRPTCAV